MLEYGHYKDCWPVILKLMIFDKKPWLQPKSVADLHGKHFDSTLTKV